MNSKKRGTPRPPPTFRDDIDDYPDADDNDNDDDDYDEAGESSAEYADNSCCSSFEEPMDAAAVEEEREQEDCAIVRHIASFLTLADAASMASMDRIMSQQSLATVSHMGRSVPSWASFGIATPETPGLMALSPSEGGFMIFGDDNDDHDEDEEYDQDLRRKLNHRRKQWVQQKLSQAIFSHPRSMRSFCLDAHKAALDITQQRNKEIMKTINPETHLEPNKEQK